MSPLNPDLYSYDREHFTDREQERRELCRAILDSRRVVVYGLAGIGKSALVGAAFEAVSPDLGERRYYIDCDRADSSEKVITAVARQVGLTDQMPVASEPRALRNAVSNYLAAQDSRSLIVLDNLETISEPDPIGTRDLLDELAGTPLVGVVVALRCGDLPAALSSSPWKPLPVHKLDRNWATELFLTWAARFTSEKAEVEKLVDTELDGVPLAIELFARQAAQDTRAELSSLRRSLRLALMTLPVNVGGDRRRSLEASLQVSIRHLKGTEAERLLALLGALPGGIAEQDLRALEQVLDAPGDLRQASARLRELGLALGGPERLNTLKPIRDHLDQALWPRREDLVAARSIYVRRLGQDSEAGSGASDRRTDAAESLNVRSMAATLDDRAEQCDVLIEQGQAELSAGQYASALETFRAGGVIARAARDSRRLARIALGVSGGLTGSGHAFDRADDERLRYLRDAEHLLTGEDPTLKLAVTVRLMAELHFDASAEAIEERQALEKSAAALEQHHQVDDSTKLQLKLRRVKSSSPAHGKIKDRMSAVRDVIYQADKTQNRVTAVEARQLHVALLLEAGRNDDAHAERAATNELILQLDDDGAQQRFERQERIMRRAQLLFQGQYDLVREELKERPPGTMADSPYRRWLHQQVLLALDTGDPQDCVARVDELAGLLKEAEKVKFGLSEAELRDLAYEWWPTWRATLALVLAMRGGNEDCKRAHDLIDELARPSATGEKFGRILPHEYYVQVFALLTLALQRLCALAHDHEQQSHSLDAARREKWAEALDQRLAPFAGCVVVPGSAVMNLGSVDAFRAMVKACAGEWWEVEDLFHVACEQNRELGSPPAVVRTLVAQAEMERLHKTEQGLRRACAAAEKGLKLARDTGMSPWERRAEELLFRLV